MQGARVLVVEDSEAIRDAVVDALAAAGYVAGGRGDGGGLEDVLESFRPDLVVLDVMLPGRDGFALIGVVRERTDAGIVLLTARDALGDRLRGLDGGADDYVVKWPPAAAGSSTSPRRSCACSPTSRPTGAARCRRRSCSRRCGATTTTTRTWSRCT